MKITIEEVRTFKERLQTLSANVVRPSFGDGQLTLWCEKKKLFVFAAGNGSYGFFWVETQEKWDSPIFSVLQTLLTKVASLLSDDQPLTLEFDDGMIVAKNGELEFSMRGTHAKEKPHVEVPKALLEFDLSKEEIQEIQRKVVPAAGEVGSSLESVGIVVKGGKASVNATNKYAIGWKNLSLPNASDAEVATPLNVWSLTPSNGGTLHYKVTGTMTIVSGEDFKYLFTNLSHSLPPYESVKNYTFTHGVKVEKGEFAEAMKAVQLLAQAGPNPLEVYFQKDSIILYTEDKELGKTKVRLSAEVPDDAVGKYVGFSYDTFIKGINASDENVEMLLDLGAGEKFPFSPVGFMTGEGSRMTLSPQRLVQAHLQDVLSENESSRVKVAV